ncbi:hypothetical protein PCIT_b0288 [Pseudoalteromonas citrea]|uniref:Uncharacterized protein n=1 Tax=Pseudoalteromonas citrea TaxID=43655 RepID=A0AAD4AE86_9GAMM|nr:hypothetical protein PCIT_b0288 [Pseudoalteromonas citrea]
MVIEKPFCGRLNSAFPQFFFYRCKAIYVTQRPFKLVQFKLAQFRWELNEVINVMHCNVI